jgi:hypothetical protein
MSADPGALALLGHAVAVLIGVTAWGAMVLDLGAVPPRGVRGMLHALVLGVVLLMGVGTTAIALTRSLAGCTALAAGLTALLWIARRARLGGFQARVGHDESRGIGMQRWRADRWAALGAALAGAVVLLTLATGFTDRLWWDGWVIWFFKVHALATHGGVPTALLNPDGPYGFTAPRYPMALPVLVYWMGGRLAVPAAASLTGALLWACLTPLAWAHMVPGAGARRAGAVALGVALCRALAFYATGGTADIGLALGLLGGALAWRDYARSGRAASAWEAATYLALAAMMKEEGVMLAIVAGMLGGLVLAVARHERRRMLWLALFAPILAAAPWWAVTHRAAGVGRFQSVLTNASAGTVAEPGVVDTALSRLPDVLAGLWTLGTTLTFLPVLLLAVLGGCAALSSWSAVRPIGRRAFVVAMVPTLILLGYLAGIVAAYCAAPADVEWLLRTAGVRVLVSLVPATVVLSCLSLSRTPPSAEAGGLE